MGTFFKILGIIFVVVIVAVLLAFFFIRRKWNELKALEKDTIMPPLKIHLNENLNPEWLNSEETQRLVDDLKAIGFSMGKAYDIVEMPQVRLLSLFHAPRTIVAVLYKHENGFNWVDIAIEYEDGTDFCVSNAPSGGEIDSRPGSKKIAMPGATIEELFSTFTREIESKPIKPINNEDFRQNFEESYQKDMTWRAQQGGASEEEIRRIAEKSGIKLDNVEYQDAIIEIKLKEIFTWHEACIETALEDKGVPKEKWEFFKQRYFIVSDGMHPEAFLKYLEDYMDISKTAMLSFKKKISDIEKTGELFARINETFSSDLRAKMIGQVNHPIHAVIYQSPLE